MRICFIPIDNRPVCCSLPADIAACDTSMEFFIPPKEFIGGLNKPANIEKIYDWLHNIPAVDCTILSLDTIAYGGLIPSRRSNLSINEIQSRLEKFKTVLQNKSGKIFAFSSIMRISNNNINIEEKEYWAEYGKKIFNYSFARSKYGENSKECRNAAALIPAAVLDDYLSTRKRNFEINKLYLKWKQEGFFNLLIFSKDDTAQYGINIDEAHELQKLGADVITGADEIPLTLLARTIEKNISICPIFTEENSKNLISNYEDVSVATSVIRQAELAGFKLTSYKDADIILVINNFKEHQGEIVMKIDTEPFNGNFIPPDKPYIIADVRFANGADNAFVNTLFNQGKDKNFIAYSAWNTTANTTGSLLCITKFVYRQQNLNRKMYEKLVLTRFLDDWAYQANIRQTLKETADITNQMQPYIEKAAEFLKIPAPKCTFDYPWMRLFEINVNIEMEVKDEFNRSHTVSDSSLN